jgi:hypothetical protein
LDSAIFESEGFHAQDIYRAVATIVQEFEGVVSREQDETADDANLGEVLLFEFCRAHGCRLTAELSDRTPAL